MITYRSSAKFDKQASVVLISKDQIKSKKFNFTNKSLKDQISTLVQSNQFSGEDGQIYPVMIKKQMNLLVGIGTGIFRNPADSGTGAGNTINIGAPTVQSNIGAA